MHPNHIQERHFAALLAEGRYGSARVDFEGRGGQAAEPATARQSRARPLRHRDAPSTMRATRSSNSTASIRVRPRQRHRAQAARRRQALAVHGAGPHSRRAADGRPVPRARRARRSLRQRFAAHHDAPEHPVPRRRQGRAQGDDRGNQRGAVDDAGRLRRRRAHRHGRAGADPRPGPRPARSRRPAPVERISCRRPAPITNLGRRALAGDGDADERRPALRRALSAAQVQDRPGDPRGQYDRRLDQRSRHRRAVRGRPASSATISCSAAGTG